MAVQTEQRPSADRAEFRLEGATQADGDHTINVAPTFDPYFLTQWQLHYEPSGGPSAGTLDVRVQQPGAATFKSIGTIAMTAVDVMTFTGIYQAIQLSPSNYDGSDYNVYLLAHNG